MGGLNRRDVEEAAREEYDMIVVGGGIYGACLALEAVRRGLKPLLLEREDFGGATSWNSLRILHGGLRYLQSLDLRRFRESVGERNWFGAAFPDLVRPLPCLMPLYGRGLKRPGVFKAALLANDLLSYGRNTGLPDPKRVGRGAVVGPSETICRLQSVKRAGLKGAAIWYDAMMTNSQRVVMEILRWACSGGARVLNYVEAVNLCKRRPEGVFGVVGQDRISGREARFAAPIVVNCAGPWSGRVARNFGERIDSLFRPSIAFNLLLDRPPVCNAAVAVEPPEPGARVYFLQPWRGRVLAGTYHAPLNGEKTDPRPKEADVKRMLADLSRALPSLGLEASDILQVYSGLLPVRREGGVSLAVRELIHHHGDNGGAHGLFSVRGVKFTTARLVAEKTLERIASAKAVRLPEYKRLRGRPRERRRFNHIDPTFLFQSPPETAAAILEEVVHSESVLFIEDLIDRRADWGSHPDWKGKDVAARVRALMPNLRSRHEVIMGEATPTVA